VAALALALALTVHHVQTSFHAQTAVPLVRVASASTSEVTTLVTRPQSTARFGRFELYVLHPATARATLRALYQGRRPGRDGVRWVPDQNTGVTAMTQVGTNVVVNWFPPGGMRKLDARWTRLHAVTAKLVR
jgi:hypothetical protein